MSFFLTRKNVIFLTIKKCHFFNQKKKCNLFNHKENGKMFNQKNVKLVQFGMCSDIELNFYLVE